MIVTDTGPLVAAAVRDDAHHGACVELFARLRSTRRAVLVPAPVVTEAGYLMNRLGGPDVEAAFLQTLGEATLTPVDLLPQDYLRAADLIRSYRDLRIGTVDASVIAVAERLRVTEVATIDHRHFRAIRPAHVPAFTLLP